MVAMIELDACLGGFSTSLTNLDHPLFFPAKVAQTGFHLLHKLKAMILVLTTVHAPTKPKDHNI
jgi:hypothetical protein